MAKKKTLKKTLVKTPKKKKIVPKQKNKSVKKPAKKASSTKAVPRKRSSKKPSTKKVTSKRNFVKKAGSKKLKTQLNIQKPNVKKIDYSKAVTPLGERIVIKLAQAEQVTAGGIIIPNNVETKSGYLKGQVLAIGLGLKTKKGHIKPLDVQIGDTVLFQAYASIKVEFNSEELHIVNESDVLGIV